MKIRALNKWAVLCAVIFGLIFAGCNDGGDSAPDENPGGQQGTVTPTPDEDPKPEPKPDENPDDQTKVVTLKERLASAKDGDVIDITAEKLSYTDSVSLTVDKSVTIKNGSANDSTFEIKAKGVIFDGVSGVKQFIIANEVGDGDFTVKNGDELEYLNVNGEETSGAGSIRIVSTAVESAMVEKKGVRIVLGEEAASAVSSVVSRAAQSRAVSRASIKKITVNEPCILESFETLSENECAFSRVSVAAGVESLTLRGNAAIEQLVVASSESTILVGSNDVKIEQAAGAGLNEVKIESEPEKNIDVTEIKKVKPLNLSGSQWKVWTDNAYLNDGGKAVINDFGEDSITVTANKTPSRFPWDANMNFWFELEKESVYLVEFEAKFTGTPKETTFNIYDGTQKANICVAPFAPTAEWKKYRFMAPIHSSGAVEDFPGYKDDLIEFSFRLTEGTLEVKDFKVYDCWAEDFLYESELNKWDLWFRSGCGASVMLYDVYETAAKAIRVLDNREAEIDDWMTNVGYMIGELSAGKYCFSFKSAGGNSLHTLNVHIGSDGNNKELGQAVGFNGDGRYYVEFDVPEEKSGEFFVMQFWFNRDKDSMEEWSWSLVDMLDVSDILCGPSSEIDIPAGAKALTYTVQEQ